MMVSLLAALALAAPDVDVAALSLPPPVERLLVTGKWDATPGSFRILTLSHVADLCAARAAGDDDDVAAAAARCVARVKVLAERTAPKGVSFATNKAGLLADTTTQHGLWLTHYNLVLARYFELHSDDDAARFHVISRSLMERSKREKTGIAPSYPGEKARWPADQAATLASLARHDRLYGSHLVDAVWDAYVAVPRDKATNLPWSDAAQARATSKLPRGCALSYSIRYLAEVNLEYAEKLWSSYTKHYLTVAGPLAGFREWPPGVSRKGDIDSGPIVAGVGAAATAFGLIAANAVDADLVHAGLAATAAAAEATGLGAGVADTAMAAVIRELGR